jgi:hypothetical protein
VRSIRRRYAAGEHRAAIADDHGISRRLVNLIAQRKRHSGVPD